MRARDPGEIVTDRDTALKQEGMGHRQFIGQTEPKASRQKKLGGGSCGDQLSKARSRQRVGFHVKETEENQHNTSA